MMELEVNYCISAVPEITINNKATLSEKKSKVATTSMVHVTSDHATHCRFMSPFTIITARVESFPCFKHALTPQQCCLRMKYFFSFALRLK